MFLHGLIARILLPVNEKPLAGNAAVSALKVDQNEILAKLFNLAS